MPTVTAWQALRGWVAALVVVALVVGGVALVRDDAVPTRSVTAEFASAPGLFPGNQVSILGMPVGRVTSVEPGPGGVEVRFDVPADLPLPDQVQVMIMAPNLISDRFLALHPAWTSGPKLADPATIPVARTASPVSADQIIKSVSQLAQALGPDGANANGELDGLLHSLATSFGPDGKPLNDTITNLGQALGALGAQGPDLTLLLDSLGQLTTAASQNLASYESFAGGLASVSATLAAEKGDIATALAALQQALGQLSTFVTDNAATLAGSVDGLNTFAASLTRQQQALAETFRTMPLALANLDAAVDRGPDGASLTVRYDPTRASQAFGKAACGDPVLRLLTLALADKQGSTPYAQQDGGKQQEDFLCGLNGVVSQLPTPDGAADPDLGVLLTGKP